MKTADNPASKQPTPAVGPVRDLYPADLLTPLTGAIGSVLGLVGPVSVHCDWVR